jgi:transcription antitermination protein NusB
VTGSRRQSREAALRILYLSEVGGVPTAEAVEMYFNEHEPEATDDVREFATTLVQGTTSHQAELDQLIERHAKNWRIERLAVIDRLIIRMAAWELGFRPDTPAPVAINEAIELARQFSSEDSVRFVNGVLDGLRKAQGGTPAAP